MPNWCMNELTITGPADKVSAWATLHTTKFETSTSVLDFNKSVPEPLDENGFGNVNWQYDNWGTKWGACDTSYIDFKEGHIVIAFDTAWGPADTWIHTMSDMFPDLEFHCRYAEPGMMFAGDIYAGPKGYSHEQRSDDELCNDDLYLMGAEHCQNCRQWEHKCTCE